MRRFALVLLAAVLVAGLFGLNKLRSQDGGRALLQVAKVDPLVVLTARPQKQTIIRTVQAPGEIEAVLKVEIRSEIPARIEEMPFEENDRVKAGDVVCRLNSDEYRAMVESGEATVAKLAATIQLAEADLDKSERDWERQEKLAKSESSSYTEQADYRTMLRKARASVEIRKQELAESEAMLRRARENLKKTTIISPIDGIVSKVYAKTGEVVITGTMNNPGTVIMDITDLSRMKVRARVDETDVPLVKVDQPVNIFLPSDPEKPIPGWVMRVATAGVKPLGRDVVTFESLVLVDSDDPAIKPGMTANVEIEVARKEDSLTVPIQAVVSRKRKDLPEELVERHRQRQGELGLSFRSGKAQYLSVVFCMEGDKTHPRLVRTGIADETVVEVIEGVGPDDVVIIGPYRSLDQLKDGSPVKLEEPKKAEPTASPSPTPAAEERQTAAPAAAEPVDEQVAKDQ